MGLAYIQLMLAIVLEVLGTAFLTISDGFSRWQPTLITIILYLASFTFLSKVVQVIPVGIAYAIWGGVGIALTAMIGYFYFKNALNIGIIAGLILIIIGVVLVSLSMQNQ